VTNLVVDLLYVRLDPRVRLGASDNDKYGIFLTQPEKKSFIHCCFIVIFCFIIIAIFAPLIAPTPRDNLIPT